MAVIKELSRHLANLIAAGEVVERPSSVAKELIENSIDAGATKIIVEIQNGGISFLRITDNGCGMSSEDALISFKRHATSKLRTEEDLMAIGTLGFRGEALAAISSVSRIDLLTKQKDTLSGTHIHMEGGTVTEHEEAGCPDGTTFVIRDIFYNVPARMKFLKKDYTEAGYISSVVQNASLSHPEIAFVLIKDGKTIFTTSGDNKLISPVFAVFGRETTENMTELQLFEREKICVWGYITKPHYARANRSLQHFFLNGRYVKNRTIQAALEEAYRNNIISGKYPSCALFITLPLELVDVNVHPAKTEIKFAREKDVFEAVYIACKNAIQAGGNTPMLTKKNTDEKQDNITIEQQKLDVSSNKVELNLGSTNSDLGKTAVYASAKTYEVPAKQQPSYKPRTPSVDCEDDFDTDYIEEKAQPTIIKPMEEKTEPLPSVESKNKFTPIEPIKNYGLTNLKMEQPPLKIDFEYDEPHKANHETQQVQTSKQTQIKSEEIKSEVKETKSLPDIKIIGEAFKTYIIAQDENGLILIDKHAAHERSIFNKLKEQVQIPSQQLLTPIIYKPSIRDFSIINDNISQIQNIGFDIDVFGSDCFAVRSAPAYLDSADIESVLDEIVGKINTNRNIQVDKLDDLIHTVSCKAAIKAGSISSDMEMQEICQRVLYDDDMLSCPHGRPVSIRFTRYELDKLFKRVNQ